MVMYEALLMVHRGVLRPVYTNSNLKVHWMRIKRIRI